MCRRIFSTTDALARTVDANPRVASVVCARLRRGLASMAVVGLGLRLRRMGLRRVGLWLRLRSLSSTTALTTAARPVAIGPWLGLHSPPYRPGLLFSGLLFSAILTVNSEPSRTWLSLAVGTECMSGTPRYSLRVLVYTLSSRVGP